MAAGFGSFDPLAGDGEAENGSTRSSFNTTNESRCAPYEC
jgi:hypothetical protein